jgi:hypothetical protein
VKGEHGGSIAITVDGVRHPGQRNIAHRRHAVAGQSVAVFGDLADDLYDMGRPCCKPGWGDADRTESGETSLETRHMR